VLPAANAVACLLFVLLRQPISGEYLAEREAVHRRGGLYLQSGLNGTIACRSLYSWSEWHGGEAAAVKILETVNLPALLVAGVTDTVGLLGVAPLMSFCAWSWALASVFLAVSSVQWLLVGAAVDAAIGRWRRRDLAQDR
jgi:hypothetical protein